MEAGTELTLEIQFPDDLPEISNPHPKIPALKFH
jgi:hypothetical protein